MANSTYKELINTEGVAASAANLKRVNENIKRSFDQLTGKARSLESDWNSKAGSIACSKMYELFKISGTRYSVIQNYVNILEQQVDPGYENTEQVNSSLADQFK